MNHELKPLVGSLLIATLVVVGVWVGSSIYRRYTELKRWQSALLCALAAGVPAFFVVMPRDHGGSGFGPQQAIGTILLSLLIVPFVVRLYRKWIGGDLTDAEKLPGMDGVRAWLGVGNVICAVLLPICAWQVFQVSLPAMFALTFGLLLAYPLFNMASATTQPAPVTAPEDLSNEREKVLQLLEAGKINADESAELLNALGQSVPSRPPPASEMELSSQRKIVLLGAALLLLGFFLPWFSVNPAAVINEMAAKFQQGMNQVNLSIPGGTLSLPGATVQVHAGDVAHGLGWWILALGIGAAVLPFFATNLKAQLQKKVILAALAIGVFLLVYLLSNNFRFVSIGVILALAGYALEIVGTLKERVSAG